MTIKTKNLYLKKFSNLDITENYLRWLNDKKITRFSNQKFIKHNFKSSQTYLNTFKNSNNLFFSINQKQDKKEKSNGQAKGKDSTEGKQSSLGASGPDPIDSGVNALFGVSEKLKKTQQISHIKKNVDAMNIPLIILTY